MNSKIVFEIRELAQEFMEPPRVVMNGSNAVFMYDYETDTGNYEWTGITFLNIIKYRHIKEHDIKEYMIKAYNRVIELDDSEWKREIMDNRASHYVVYFDGYGAYEFLCQGFTKGIVQKDINEMIEYNRE